MKDSNDNTNQVVQVMKAFANITKNNELNSKAARIQQRQKDKKISGFGEMLNKSIDDDLS
jgi:hypothetical protein